MNEMQLKFWFDESTHPAATILDDYLEGRLDVSAGKEIAGHVSQCWHCARALERLANLSVKWELFENWCDRSAATEN